MLLGTLVANSLGNLLTGREKNRTGEGVIATIHRKCTIRAGQDF